MNKYIIQIGMSQGTVTNDPWYIVEGDSVEEVAEKHLLDQPGAVIKIMSYAPMIFSRGVKRLNPQMGMGCYTGTNGGL